MGVHRTSLTACGLDSGWGPGRKQGFADLIMLGQRGDSGVRVTVSKSTGKPNRIFELTQNLPEDGRERRLLASGTAGPPALSAAFSGDDEAVVPMMPLGFPCAPTCCSGTGEG